MRAALKGHAAVECLVDGRREALCEVRHRQFNLKRSRLYRERASTRTVDGANYLRNHPLRNRGRSSGIEPEVRGHHGVFVASSNALITRLRIAHPSAWSQLSLRADRQEVLAALGYPFASLTAIVLGGRAVVRSGDRPAALAAIDRPHCDDGKTLLPTQASPTLAFAKTAYRRRGFASRGDPTARCPVAGNLAMWFHHCCGAADDVVLGGTPNPSPTSITLARRPGARLIIARPEPATTLECLRAGCASDRVAQGQQDRDVVFGMGAIASSAR